ncbi:hypothetical protein VNO77_18440 [Canavalia gladiata]|uniref:EIF2B subunit epsilon/gamma LbH domain-containing protein n=1 Tax=Canavalia gladiata TaxID=3824 RepID=A0AAN9LQT0_CANGL
MKFGKSATRFERQFVYRASGCRIGSNVLIEGCYIWDKIIIEDGCKLQHAIVCDGVTIKSGAILEPGVVLSFKVIVGQEFVVPPYSKVFLLQQPIEEDSDEELEYADSTSAITSKVDKSEVGIASQVLETHFSPASEVSSSCIGTLLPASISLYFSSSKHWLRQSVNSIACLFLCALTCLPSFHTTSNNKTSIAGVGHVRSACEGGHEEEWRHSVATIPADKIVKAKEIMEDDLELTRDGSFLPP